MKYLRYSTVKHLINKWRNYDRELKLDDLQDLLHRGYITLLPDGYDDWIFFIFDVSLNCICHDLCSITYEYYHTSIIERLVETAKNDINSNKWLSLTPLQTAIHEFKHWTSGVYDCIAHGPSFYTRSVIVAMLSTSVIDRRFVPFMLAKFPNLQVCSVTLFLSSIDQRIVKLVKDEALKHMKRLEFLEIIVSVNGVNCHCTIWDLYKY